MKRTWAQWAVWFALVFNVGAAAGYVSYHRWGSLAFHAAFGCLGIYTVLLGRQTKRVGRYCSLLIERAQRVSNERMEQEPLDELEARHIALLITIDRAYRRCWIRPWGAVEWAALDLELFGVPISERAADYELETP